MNIPAVGTTHVDDFGSDMHCSISVTEDEIFSDYERNTEIVIIETLNSRDIQRDYTVLVREHGPFVWENTEESRRISTVSRTGGDDGIAQLCRCFRSSEYV